MPSYGPTCVGEILAPRLSGKDLGEFGRIEATEFDFLHRASQDDVSSIVEGEGPAGQAEDMDIGNLDDDILERSKEREQLRPGIVNVVEDQEGAASSHVLSEDLDRVGEVPAHQDGTQTGLAQRNQKIAERGEHGLWSVPRAHPMPKQIPLRAEQFTSPCSEGRLADSRHASHYEEAGTIRLSDGTEFLLATDEPLDARCVREHLHAYLGRSNGEGLEIHDSALDGPTNDFEKRDSGRGGQDFRHCRIPNPVRVARSDRLRLERIAEADRREPSRFREVVHLSTPPTALNVGDTFAREPLADQRSNVLGDMRHEDPHRLRDAFLRHVGRNFHRIGVARELEQVEENPLLCGDAHLVGPYLLTRVTA